MHACLLAEGKLTKIITHSWVVAMLLLCWRGHNQHPPPVAGQAVTIPLFLVRRMARLQQGFRTIKLWLVMMGWAAERSREHQLHLLDQLVRLHWVRDSCLMVTAVFALTTTQFSANKIVLHPCTQLGRRNWMDLSYMNSWWKVRLCSELAAYIEV